MSKAESFPAVQGSSRSVVKKSCVRKEHFVSMSDILVCVSQSGHTSKFLWRLTPVLDEESIILSVLSPTHTLKASHVMGEYSRPLLQISVMHSPLREFSPKLFKFHF